MEMCPICKAGDSDVGGTARHTLAIKCRKCGDFESTNQVNSYLSNLTDKERAMISGWVFEQNQAGGIPSLSVDILEGVKSLTPPTIIEKTHRLLALLHKMFPKYRDKLRTDAPCLIASIYGEDYTDVSLIFQLLVDQGLVERPKSGGLVISPKGFIKLEEWALKGVASDQAFVAMSFDKKMGKVWEKGLLPGIKKAGYRPLRVDKEEKGEFSEKICDEIIAQIKNSKFLVADFTGQKHGVYFEAGFAMGLNIPVIWTCERSEVEDKKLHFDIRQYKFIDWETPDELAEKLKNRILATINKGPGRTP